MMPLPPKYLMEFDHTTSPSTGFCPCLYPKIKIWYTPKGDVDLTASPTVKIELSGTIRQGAVVYVDM